MVYKLRVLTKKCTDKERNTLLFAAEELQKYISLVSDIDFCIIPSDEFCADEKNTLFLGIDISVFNVSKGIYGVPRVDNAELDDSILISVSNFSGVISGSNARSVLIAVYRFLKELGFSFLNPGKNGERYPETLPQKDVCVCEKASYRHRAICIEGSTFQKCITDTIDWLPKAAMNGYLMQFFVPKVFLERWYHEDNPYRSKAMLSEKDHYAILSLIEKEIEKRSLLYHGVGHGWTTAPLGIKMSSWSAHNEPDAKYKELLALVNGKRKLYLDHRPTCTELCYSNPKAREMLTDCLVEYCKEHQNLSYLHFWLADGSNNKCECDECKKLRISDWYVMMLNMLDEKLTKEGIDTRIVFIVYVDTFWPPIKEKFANNDRFLLQYAPITRTYTSSFKSSKKGEMLPYELNKLTFPTKVEDNLEYLRAWKKNFSCDSVIFDYHFTWDHYLDFPQYNHARILSEDIKSLEDIGLNGLMNCKVQRTYLPSSLGVNVMADTLWNKESDFEAISDSVLRAEFGDAYTKVKEYLSDLSVYGCPKAFRGEESFVENDNIDSIKKVVDIIKNFRSVLQKEMCTGDSKVMFAWKKLEFFSDLYELLLNFTLDSVQKDEIADDSELRDFVQKNEMWIKDEFDAMYFLMVFQNRILRAIKNDKELFLGNADN